MPSRSREKLSISQLQALEAVARAGNVTLAAKQLGISQPSVTNHIQALENRFKTRFFTRTGYTSVPTPVLNRMLPRIRAILSLMQDLEKELTDRGALDKGELRIGYSTHQLAIPAISGFMQAHPNIRIEARDAASKDLLNQLESGTLDLAFVTAKEAPSGFHAKRVCTSRVVLMVPRDHALAKRPHLTWRDVEGLPLIQREATSGTRRIFESAARLNQIPLKTLLALGSWDAIVSLVNRGTGFGVAMEAEVSLEDSIAGVPVDDQNLTLSHYLICPKDMVRIAAVAAFLDSVRTA